LYELERHFAGENRGSIAGTAMTPEDILQFWFADSLSDPSKAKLRMPFWFQARRETDEHIAARFAPTVRDAAMGSLAQWERQAPSCLALIIVLDQFPRHIHRGTAAAFEHDPQTLAVTRRGVAAGHLRALHTVEQGFFLLPFEHSEELAAQREGVALFEPIVAQAPVEWRPVADHFLDYTRRHLKIIERFGRFPHRNSILGRRSTPAEEEYLKSNAETFGQKA
jgi:uncharacterized protein (DUF924 family)